MCKADLDYKPLFILFVSLTFYEESPRHAIKLLFVSLVDDKHLYICSITEAIKENGIQFYAVRLTSKSLCTSARYGLLLFFLLNITLVQHTVHAYSGGK